MLLPLFLACAHPVDITVSAASIAPTMANGAAWDGPDKLPPAAMGLLDSAMAKLDPSGQLGAAVAGAAGQMAQPDVAGTAEFRGDAESAPITAIIPEVSDSLGPTWAVGSATLRGVTLGSNSVLRITLVDKDLQSDDPIGVAVITAADLARAEHTDGAVTVDVSGQTSGQVKSVSVVVSPAAPAAPAAPTAPAPAEKTAGG